MALDGQATAFWIRHQDISIAQPAGGQRRHFESLRNAVSFVMEKLTELEQGTAMVTADFCVYRIKEIREIYEGADFANG
jgi:hypothetical protein